MARVIWIVNEYNRPNGIRTRQTVLSQHLEEYGYEVYLICGSSSNSGEENWIKDGESIRFEESDGAKYFVIKTSDYRKNYERAFVALQFQYRLWRMRDKLPKPDVIISDFAGFFGYVFVKWKKKYGTKIIYDILDLWPEGFVAMGYLKSSSLIAKALYYLEYQSYRAADGIIFSMQGGKDYITDKGWSIDTGGELDISNIGYLNNGVDLETVDKQRTEFFFDDPDLDSDKFKAIYIGSISEFNGIDVLVEVARVIQSKKADNILILVYGYGTQESKLKQLAKDYALNNIVFKGRLDKKYAMNVLSRGDINLFTFKNTTLLKYGISPNKLFMYFASGKPVLSMIRPNYDLVEERQAGYSVDNNPEKIAKALIDFSIMDREKYQQYCRNSRRLGEEYDYKNLVKVLIEQIERA